MFTVRFSYFVSWSKGQTALTCNSGQCRGACLNWTLSRLYTACPQNANNPFTCYLMDNAQLERLLHLFVSTFSSKKYTVHTVFLNCTFIPIIQPWNSTETNDRKSPKSTCKEEMWVNANTHEVVTDLFNDVFIFKLILKQM